MRTMEGAFAKSSQEVVNYFQSNIDKGLSEDQVRKYGQIYGLNELPSDECKTILQLVAKQFEILAVKILLLATIISFILAFFESKQLLLAAFAEPLIVLLILIAYSMVNVWLELYTQCTIKALKEYMPMMGNVVRQNQNGIQTINAKDLVPGDIVEVSVGDIVPADIRLVKIMSTIIRANQFIITGESSPVIKHTDCISDMQAINHDKKNILFCGTTVALGNAIGIVIGTSSDTAIGKICIEMRETKVKTLLQQNFDKFSQQISKVITDICVAVWAINIGHYNDLDHSDSWVKGAIFYFKIAVALVVVTVPKRFTQGGHHLYRFRA